VRQAEVAQPRLVLVELPLHVDDFEERPADHDRLAAEDVELRAQVLRHGGRAPAELDDRDVLAARLEDVLPRAWSETLVEDMREPGVALPRGHSQESVLKARHRAPAGYRRH
jgi:hypothetical protein